MQASTTRKIPLRRMLSGVSTVSITALTVAAAAFAVIEGADGLARQADAAAPPRAAEALPVPVTELRLEDGYETDRQFVGRIEPRQQSSLSFESGGLVTEILVDEGDRVAAGEVIARLDTSLLGAERTRLEAVRDALEASLAFASLSLDRRQALEARGYSPSEALDRARSEREALQAQISETDAALEATGLRIEKSALRAPYGGIVGARDVDEGTSISAGAPVLRLMMDGPVHVRVGIPLWLDPADLDRGVVRSEGRELPARLIATRPDIDPDTRTRTVILAVEADGLPFGSTATVSVPRKVAQSGVWVDLSMLREGAPGVWTILVVDAEDRVRALAVEVQQVRESHAFVSGGLVPGLRLVTAGPQRVVPGQQVRPVMTSAGRL